MSPCESKFEIQPKHKPVEVSIPRSVKIVELEVAPFNNAESAKTWACAHGIPGLMSNIDSNNKGEIAISLRSIEKMLSGSAVRKSVTPGIHFAALMRVRDIIRESFVAEIHPDYKKVDGVRSVKNGINPMLQIAVLYGAVSMAGIVYRAKTTLKLYRDTSMPTKAYSYEISNIEILKGNAAPVARPNNRTSMSVGILLNGVLDVNGRSLLK